MKIPFIGCETCDAAVHCSGMNRNGEQSSSGEAPQDAPASPLVAATLERVESVFDTLGAYSCLSSVDRIDFAFYRSLYRDFLYAIDERILKGDLTPVRLDDFPLVVRFPGYHIKAALFIGTFDPFQMTHLATALRYLATAGGEAPVVFVVPEGHNNPEKPGRSEYRYRFDLLSMQIRRVFEPLIVPLDIGEGADTVEIIRRFISMFPGARVSITHLFGTDTLPIAASLLPEDLRIWRLAAEEYSVDFAYRAFVVSRDGAPDTPRYAGEIRSLGLDIQLDEESIGAPSSTDFREKHAFSIIFPTESMIHRLEVLYRYNINQPWRI